MEAENSGVVQIDKSNSNVKAATETLVVAAIDIGTTFSGYAFSFYHDFKKDPTHVISGNWAMRTGNLISCKTPTSILFDENDQPHSFGYEAEEAYTEKLMDDPEEAKKWSLFRRFKMKLYDNVRIYKGFLLKSTNGNIIPALTVFASSIRFMKDAMLTHCDKTASGIKMDDISWVLTVPAIWSDPAKKFMRAAAEEAGIEAHRLTLALEPEAAALFIRHIPFEKQTQVLAVGYEGNEDDSSILSETTMSLPCDVSDKEETKIGRCHDFANLDGDEITTGIEQCRLKDDFSMENIKGTDSIGSEKRQERLQKSTLVRMGAGVKYMVIDAGGGTTDIAVHERREDDTVREIYMANGGNWGGTKVDEAFRKFLVELVSPEETDSNEGDVVKGREVLKTFEKNFIDDDLELKRDFEHKKRGISKSMKSKLIMKIPPTLMETFAKLNPSANMKQVNQHWIKGSVKHGKLQIDKSVACSFFEEPLRQTVEHLKKIFSEPEVEDTNKILMVGGFSESSLLVSAIREAFPGKVIRVPPDAGLAVLKGAVIFGHDPNVFYERISKFTYGVGCECHFDENTHPQKNKRIDKFGEEWCHNLFDIHVRFGEAIRYGEPQSIRSYLPSRFVKNGVFNFSVFCTKSEKPMFVTDIGVHKAGQVTLRIPPDAVDYESDIIVSFSFSGTELEAVAEYTKTGQRERSYIGYLE